MNKIDNLKYLPEISGNINLNGNFGLLVYNTNKLSDNDFLSQKEYAFWYEIYKQEQTILLKEDIIKTLNIQDLERKKEIKKL